MSILRDTGATVDVICQKYVDRDRMKGEQVWVPHLLDDHMTCLPVAEVDIECDLGTERERERVTSKAAVIGNHFDQRWYILGNQTAALLQGIEKNCPQSVKKGNEADYGIKNGILVKKKINKLGIEEYLIVVPEALREQNKTICHDGTSGHLGVLKTKDRLLRHFFWPKCYKEIEDFVKTCDPCQRVGKTNDRKKALW
ncbi:retrovirus-related Pol polyprotein from transposon 297 [Trichonephila clavipes]|nr:retrovirus-related Pol polyprotein from transposon 297 [Trichonephila clavipes]